jgi:hypothetical protein
VAADVVFDDATRVPRIVAQIWVMPKAAECETVREHLPTGTTTYVIEEDIAGDSEVLECVDRLINVRAGAYRVLIVRVRPVVGRICVDTTRVGVCREVAYVTGATCCVADSARHRRVKVNPATTERTVKK